MGLPIILEKVEEARDYVLYAFGSADTTVGRVRLYKSTGDIELASFPETTERPGERYYLAQAVPRLRSYQERDTYPDLDRWEA